MTYVDSAVLDLTERLCRRLQTWTGRTNVWLAFQLTNLSIVCYFIWAAGLYLLSVDVVLRVFVALFCAGAIPRSHLFTLLGHGGSGSQART